MEELSISEEMQKIVEINGDEVGIHSAPCITFKAEHKNCAGCQYELGCGKVVRLMSIMLIPQMYEPKDYADFAKMNDRIQELMGKTLKSKTTSELMTIPFH